MLCQPTYVHNSESATFAQFRVSSQIVVKSESTPTNESVYFFMRRG